MIEQPWILITGNPVGGFTYIGTFNTYDEVLAAGEDLADADWWVYQLQAFEEKE
jgi:hypothetical protein